MQIKNKSYNYSIIFYIKSTVMNLMYLWLYTLILGILWWFFIIAKIHAYKFKNFSNNIERITTLLLFVLIFLSVSWYIVLLYWIFWKSTNYVDNFDEPWAYEINY